MPDLSNQAAEILARGAYSGEVLEEFGPVWSTAILRLARESWQTAGIETFLQLEVPHTATSNGQLSEDAVDIMLKALAARPDTEPARFLELGAGSGLFAKLFLDRLRAVAPEIYRNCTYVVSDHAESILASQAGFGVLAAHKARIETITLNACDRWPKTLTSRFDGIFATYLLDCLPFDMLAVNDTQTWRLEARSVFTANDTGTLKGLKTALKRGTPEALRGFVDIGKSLAIQTRHTAMERETLPFADAVPDDTGGETLPFVHCHGALQCLEHGLKALRPGGVIIASDYGSATRREATDLFEFQSYGNSIACGVNFHQIDSHFSDRSDATLFRPDEEEGSVLTRVLGKPPLADLGATVDLLYGAVRQRALTTPIDAARQMLRARTYQVARKYYDKALRLQPRNWSLIEEIAGLMLLESGDHANARDMAECGLALNPIAAGLWRIKGAALAGLTRDEDAEASLTHAVELNPVDVLAWQARAELDLRRERHAEALAHIACGLACDTDGDYREALRNLQDRVLSAISSKEHDALLNQVNRFRALDDLP